MKRMSVALLFGALLLSPAAHAQPAAGAQPQFQDVDALMAQMTPAQRAAVMKQAALKEKELEKMSPEERDKLAAQLRTTGDTIKMDQIDPNKLNPAGMKNTAGVQKDLNKYQEKYNAGKIKNSAVKPLGSQQ